MLHPNTENEQPLSGQEPQQHSMESTFRTWTTNRHNYLKFFEKYSLEQLNRIPEAYNNNLIWHIGHIVVVQQKLVYLASGLPMNIPEDLFNRFKPGSRPDAPVTAATADVLKELLLSLIPGTISDYKAGKFVSYKDFTTSAGFYISSTEEAMLFNNYHEALHFGYMMSMCRFL